MSEKTIISIKNCSVTNQNKILLKSVTWQLNTNEAWLITGKNGSGKEEFIQALADRFQFTPNNENSTASSNKCKPEAEFISALSQSSGPFTDKTNENTGKTERTGKSSLIQIVSLEEAAKLIEEERHNDQSEILDREDAGRSVRQFLCEAFGYSPKKHTELPEIAKRLETLPQIKLCGIEKILDRGLRYLSTGEIRRTLLCKSLLTDCRLLILSNPFEGLDIESRKILFDFFENLVNRQLKKNTIEELAADSFPTIILSMDRYTEIPEGINRVLEFTDKQISWCGTKAEYEQILNRQLEEKNRLHETEKKQFVEQLNKIREESEALTSEIKSSLTQQTDSLIEFTDVNVGWETNHVLVDLNWLVTKGSHWLIQGPNGSGKTTILELITGDNMQVFREDIKLFGKRRGSGETIWDIKKRLGIVSYRLHVEYRMVGGTELLNVIISGFHDSIGLYEQPTDFETATAKQWLKLAGFEVREHVSFNSLSYGEQRAILILRAAVKSPLVLILDEPCHALDENYRQKILDLIETIAETGTTTILHVTHDETEILPCEKNVLQLLPGQSPMYRIYRK